LHRIYARGQRCRVVSPRRVSQRRATGRFQPQRFPERNTNVVREGQPQLIAARDGVPLTNEAVAFPHIFIAWKVRARTPKVGVVRRATLIGKS
jgi:hypothetical protein